MTVSLSPQLRRLVDKKVAAGSYTSAGEVIRVGLLLLEEQDRLLSAHRRAVGEKIRRGLDQLDRGEGIPGEVAHKKLQMMKARRRQPK